MFSSVTVEGFRCFSRFELAPLERVNLLVGANNSGKSAMLEAIALLASRGDPRAIVEAALRRGEVIHAEGSEVRADVRRLFHGHVLRGDSPISLSGQMATMLAHVQLRIRRLRRIRKVATDEEGKRHVVEAFLEDDDFEDAPRYLERKFEYPGATQLGQKFKLGPGDGLIWPPTDQSIDSGHDVFYVPTESLSGDEVLELVSPVLLTEAEQWLLESLRLIDEDIEGFRLAPRPSHGRYQSRESVIVKLRGASAPVPIGSLGDGVWRLFSLAAAMVATPGGVVLVDDIDTGLHYSIMERMWRQLSAIATNLDVQLFATSHSRDCYEALAATEEGLATIHRIERGRERSVVFGGAMVAAAAANDVEVR